jgi:CrcB protein
VGLLGGFTTFSAFSLDLLGMLERRDLAGALLYAGVSVLASVVALAAGLALMRSP